MPAATRKSKCTFRRIVASDPVSPAQLEAAERILARFVALAYAGDHPNLFLSEVDKPERIKLSEISGNADAAAD
ncbi:MAG: hypothetical protein FJW39_23425 [Acidobacteria bacterium]|nr:hypothetical protein [Acidobacteriota bacterium]